MTITHPGSQVVRSRRQAPAGGALLAAAFWAVAAGAPAADLESPADLVIETHVVASEPQRFGTNLRDPSELNNFTLDPGFEPTMIRRGHIATGGGARYIENRPLSGPPVWSPGTWHYRDMADGFFDGATVRVYRPTTNGTPVQLLRTAVITNYVTDGFRRLHGPPLATNRFVDASAVPGVTYEYQVRAVDTSGNVSSNFDGEVRATGTALPGPAPAPGPLPFWAGNPAPRDSARPAFPTGVGASSATGAVELAWAPNAETDLAGYYVYRRAGGTGDLWRVELDGDGPAVQAGDHYFMELVAANPPTERMHDRLGPNRFLDPWRLRGGTVWPYQLACSARRDASTLAPTNGGLACVRLEAPGAYEVSLYQPRFSAAQFHGGFYPSLEPGRRYRMEVWLKQNGVPGGQVRVGLTEHYATAAASFTVGTHWQPFTATFLAPPLPTNANISAVTLAFTGPGTVWADNFLLYEDDDGDPATYPAFALRPAALQALIDYHPGVLRGMTGADTAYWGGSMDDWTRAEPEVAMHWHGDVGKHVPDDPYKLPTLLRMARDTGGEPWLVVGSYMNEQEWRDLVEYLAAPYDPAVDTPQAKPYAWRRYAQGHPAPWTDDFDHLYLEFGDELWNPMFEWTLANGNLNGQFAEHFFQAARGSAHFTPGVAAKLRFLVNGWMLQTDPATGYGHAASVISTSSAANTVATYIGGWEAGVAVGGPTVNDVGFQDYMLYAPQVIFNYINGHAAARAANAAAGHPYEVALYEGGPGYANPSPGQPYDPVSETYGKSLAAGVATLDTYLYDSYRRVEPQAYFSFGGQYNWASHSFPAYGFNPHTSWLALQLRNRYATGAMLATATYRAPTLDVPARTNATGAALAPAAPNLPLIQPYAFRDGSRYAVFVLSRRLDAATPVTLRLPFTSITNGTLYTLTGDPRTGNSTNLAVAIAAAPLAGFSPAYTFSMPPGSVYLFVFEGAATPVPAANPAVTVALALGQAAATETGVARFHVHFSRPVTGFTAQDVRLLGTTGANAVTLTEDEPREGMDFTATVGGLASNGTVAIAIDADAVADAADGLGNLASTALDTGVLFLVPPPRNRLLAWDDFAVAPAAAPYPPFLHGTATGGGWAGAWSVQGFSTNAYTNGYHLATNPAPAFANLRARGSFAVGGRNYETAGRNLDVDGAFAAWRLPTTNAIGRDGTELWLSVLLRKEAADDNPAALALHTAGTAYGALGESRLGVGYVGPLSNNGGQRYWSLFVRNAADTGLDVIRGTVPLQAGQAALLVLRLTFGSRDRFDLFVNPPALGGEPPTNAAATWTAAATHDIRFKAVSLTGGANLAAVACDEIRLGDSYAAVTPPDAAGHVQFTAADVAADETAGTARLYVSRLEGVAGTATVEVATGAGTATAGADYEPLQTTLTWADGDGSLRLVEVPLLTDTAIETNETVTLELGRAAGVTVAAPAAAELTLLETPFNLWRYAAFDAAERTNDLFAAPEADPDGDGLANLAEYAHHRDPRTADPGGVLTPSVLRDPGTGLDYATATYTRRRAGAGVTCHVQASADLAQWHESAAVVAEWHVTEDTNSPTETVEARLVTPLGPPTNAFLRLRYSQP